MTSPMVTWLLTLISGAVGGNIGGVGGSQLLGALVDCNPSARLATSGRPELSAHCCQSSLHLEEQVCEGMMRAESRVARSGNRIYVGQ